MTWLECCSNYFLGVVIQYTILNLNRSKSTLLSVENWKQHNAIQDTDTLDSSICYDCYVASLGRCGMCGRKYWLVHAQLWDLVAECLDEKLYFFEIESATYHTKRKVAGRQWYVWCAVVNILQCSRVPAYNECTYLQCHAHAGAGRGGAVEASQVGAAPWGEKADDWWAVWRQSSRPAPLSTLYTRAANEGPCEGS